MKVQSNCTKHAAPVTQGRIVNDTITSQGMDTQTCAWRACPLVPARGWYVTCLQCRGTLSSNKLWIISLKTDLFQEQLQEGRKGNKKKKEKLKKVRLTYINALFWLLSLLSQIPRLLWLVSSHTPEPTPLATKKQLCLFSYYMPNSRIA